MVSNDVGRVGVARYNLYEAKMMSQMSLKVDLPRASIPCFDQRRPRFIVFNVLIDNTYAYCLL